MSMAIQYYLRKHFEALLLKARCDAEHSVRELALTLAVMVDGVMHIRFT